MHADHQDQVKTRLGKLSLLGQIIFRTLKLKVTRTDITDTECLKYHRTKRIKAIQKDFEGSPLLGEKKNTILEGGCYSDYSECCQVWFSLARTESSRTRKRSRAYDPVNIKNRSRKRRHKREGIGFRRIRTCSFSFDSAYDYSALYVPLMI